MTREFDYDRISEDDYVILLGGYMKLFDNDISSEEIDKMLTKSMDTLTLTDYIVPGDPFSNVFQIRVAENRRKLLRKSMKSIYARLANHSENEENEPSK